MLRLLARMAALAMLPIATLTSLTPLGDIIKTVTQKDVVLQRATRTYDTARIRTLIADDFTLITSSGRVMNADDLVADVGDTSIKWLNNDTEDVKVRAYNGDCAIVTAILHQRYEQGGTISDYRVRFTDTWVKLKGSWRYVAGHASKLR